MKRRTIVIRHLSGHQIIALIEIMSPGNKSSRRAFTDFLDKACTALIRGIHLVVVDLFPPTKRDPEGIHGAIWEEITGEPYIPPMGKQLTLVSYAAGAEKAAYVEPTAVGETLPDMPLFLDPEVYVDTPLEPTYRAAHEGLPRYYRDILEA